eukprot:TRINITY_DN3650_c0_g1_i1.p1 TRINITY_DN3650_c0_g1~~TRINITY_DN3650_c0_g1_i1.p1  ORF type:complete len:974 (+),score=339.96 TRINITY_DN3650_c0_g1_i1:150-3071(+)
MVKDDVKGSGGEDRSSSNGATTLDKSKLKFNEEFGKNGEILTVAEKEQFVDDFTFHFSEDPLDVIFESDDVEESNKENDTRATKSSRRKRLVKLSENGDNGSATRKRRAKRKKSGKDDETEEEESEEEEEEESEEESHEEDEDDDAIVIDDDDDTNYKSRRRAKPRRSGTERDVGRSRTNRRRREEFENKEESEDDDDAVNMDLTISFKKKTPVVVAEETPSEPLGDGEDKQKKNPKFRWRKDWERENKYSSPPKETPTNVTAPTTPSTPIATTTTTSTTSSTSATTPSQDTDELEELTPRRISAFGQHLKSIVKPPSPQPHSLPFTPTSAPQSRPPLLSSPPPSSSILPLPVALSRSSATLASYSQYIASSLPNSSQEPPIKYTNQQHSPGNYDRSPPRRYDDDYKYNNNVSGGRYNNRYNDRYEPKYNNNNNNNNNRYNERNDRYDKYNRGYNNNNNNNNKRPYDKFDSRYSPPSRYQSKYDDQYDQPPRYEQQKYGQYASPPYQRSPRYEDTYPQKRMAMAEPTDYRYNDQRYNVSPMDSRQNRMPPYQSSRDDEMSSGYSDVPYSHQAGAPFANANPYGGFGDKSNDRYPRELDVSQLQYQSNASIAQQPPIIAATAITVHPSLHPSSSKTVTSSSSSSSTKAKKPKPIETEKQRIDRKAFKKVVCGIIIKQLTKYWKHKRIATKDDFKHISRKLTHSLIEKKKGSTKVDETLKIAGVKIVDEFFKKHKGVYSKSKDDEKTESESTIEGDSQPIEQQPQQQQQQQYPPQQLVQQLQQLQSQQQIQQPPLTLQQPQQQLPLQLPQQQLPLQQQQYPPQQQLPLQLPPQQLQQSPQQFSVQQQLPSQQPLQQFSVQQQQLPLQQPPQLQLQQPPQQLPVQQQQQYAMPPFPTQVQQIPTYTQPPTLQPPPPPQTARPPSPDEYQPFSPEPYDTEDKRWNQPPPPPPPQPQITTAAPPKEPELYDIDLLDWS